MNAPVKPIRLGLVGCGLMGSHYADVYSKLEAVEITACCDPTPTKLIDFANKKGIKNRFTDFREMIRIGNLDGVLNVTPDFLHAPVARTVIEAGLPILTEKPFSGNLNEAIELKAISNKLGSAIMVNFSKRHCSAVAAVKTLVERGCIGYINRIDLYYRQGWVITKDWGDWVNTHPWTWRLDEAFSPLGVLSDLGSHLIDLLRHITGEEIQKVSGARLLTVKKSQAKVESHTLNSADLAEAQFTLSSGTPVSFITSRIDSGERDSPGITLYGTKGSIKVNLGENSRHAFLFQTAKRRLHREIVEVESLNSGNWTAVTTVRPPRNYQRFLEVIRGEAEPSPSVDDGFAVQLAMEAIRLSAESDGNTIYPANLLVKDSKK